MTQDNKVLFVVLNYKGWQDTLNCVESVLAQTYRQFHVMIIENDSGDESHEKLHHLGNNQLITYHQEPINHGFAGGVNIGIRHAIKNGYKYVALLNNDATIEPNWLEIMVDTIEREQVSSANGMMLYRDEVTIDSTGDGLSIWGLPFPRQREEKRDQASPAGLIFGCTAGAAVYKTNLFEEISLFDEQFFAYFEDTDISFRAQLAGHKSYYQPEAVAYHEHGSTSRKMPGFTVKQTFQNLPVFLIKNTPRQLMLSIWPRFILIYAAYFGRALLRGQVSYAFQGILGFFKRLPHAIRERRRIQASRVVEIDYLRSVIHPHLPPQNQRTVKRLLRMP